jgi:restriction system protein
MGRRRRSEGLADVLVVLPWQISALLGCVGFAALRWIVPSIFSRSPFLVGLGAVSHSFAWLALIGFGFISLMAFARAKVSSVPALMKTSDRPPKEKSIIPPLATFRPKVATEWGNDMNLDTRWGNSATTAATLTATENVPDAWSLEALGLLEWKRFELLCAKYYESVGFKCETLRCGADGGIDVKLFKIDPNKPLAVVQCKAWYGHPVGVKDIRELLGVMAHEKVGRGIFITTATFTKDALEFGTANPIQLLDGIDFTTKLRELPKERQDTLLNFAFEGDYRTPTCPSCGIKMIKRESKRGVFWGCARYPKCKSTLALRGQASAPMSPKPTA